MFKHPQSKQAILLFTQRVHGTWVSAVLESTSQWSIPVSITNTPGSMKNLSQAMTQCVTHLRIQFASLLAVDCVKPMVRLTLMTGTNTVQLAWVWLLQQESMPTVSKLDSTVLHLTQHWLMFELVRTQAPGLSKTMFSSKNSMNRQ